MSFSANALISAAGAKDSDKQVISNAPVVSGFVSTAINTATRDIRPHLTPDGTQLLWFENDRIKWAEIENADPLNGLGTVQLSDECGILSNYYPQALCYNSNGTYIFGAGCYTGPQAGGSDDLYFYRWSLSTAYDPSSISNISPVTATYNGIVPGPIGQNRVTDFIMNAHITSSSTLLNKIFTVSFLKVEDDGSQSATGFRGTVIFSSITANAFTTLSAIRYVCFVTRNGPRTVANYDGMTVDTGYIHYSQYAISGVTYTNSLFFQSEAGVFTYQPLLGSGFVIQFVSTAYAMSFRHIFSHILGGALIQDDNGDYFLYLWGRARRSAIQSIPGMKSYNQSPRNRLNLVKFSIPDWDPNVSYSTRNTFYHYYGTNLMGKSVIGPSTSQDDGAFGKSGLRLYNGTTGSNKPPSSNSSIRNRHITSTIGNWSKSGLYFVIPPNDEISPSSGKTKVYGVQDSNNNRYLRGGELPNINPAAQETVPYDFPIEDGEVVTTPIASPMPVAAMFLNDDANILTIHAGNYYSGEARYKSPTHYQLHSFPSYTSQAQAALPATLVTELDGRSITGVQTNDTQIFLSHVPYSEVSDSSYTSFPRAEMTIVNYTVTGNSISFPSWETVTAVPDADDPTNLYMVFKRMALNGFLFSPSGKTLYVAEAPQPGISNLTAPDINYTMDGIVSYKLKSPYNLKDPIVAGTAQRRFCSFPAIRPFVPSKLASVLVTNDYTVTIPKSWCISSPPVVDEEEGAIRALGYTNEVRNGKNFVLILNYDILE